MRTLQSYLDLVTPYNRNDDDFLSFLATVVNPLVQVQAVADLLHTVFDIDTGVGAQLDAVGVRVGRSRELETPLLPFFFSWDDPHRGWDAGIWAGPYDTQYGIQLLDDDTYRRLLRAKVLANIWDGTIPGQQAILDTFFLPGTRSFVEDQGVGVLAPSFFTWDDANRGWDQASWAPTYSAPASDRSTRRISVSVAGTWPTITDLELLGQGLVAAKPAGVVVDYSVTSVNGDPLFGFDMSNQYVAGWDQGAWGVTPQELVALRTT